MGFKFWFLLGLGLALVIFFAIAILARPNDGSF